MIIILVFYKTSNNKCHSKLCADILWKISLMNRIYFFFSITIYPDTINSKNWEPRKSCDRDARLLSVWVSVFFFFFFLVIQYMVNVNLLYK